MGNMSSDGGMRISAVRKWWIRRQARGGVPGAGTRARLTPEQRAALEERNRLGAPPVQMLFTIDGKQALTAVVEGSTDYN